MFIIRKSSRSGNSPYSCSITCKEADVDCNVYYKDKHKAVQDCNKLRLVNPIGFDVVHIVRLRTKSNIIMSSNLNIIMKTLQLNTV